ncbi:MAG: hypothetical protein GYA24_04695 [Candidatus Lokiarchaeota archaeon]|nr:hypothetical protein [Candidatus Lokiarchaeota archaeon]
MEIDRVKLAIIDQLKRFDGYSKKIEACKESAAMDPNAKKQLQASFSETENKIAALQRDIAVEERAIYNLLSQNPGNVKALEKQNEKISKLKQSVNEQEEHVETIITQLEEIARKEKLVQELDSIQAAYKQCLASLMNLRNRFPDSYKDAEEESGIFFLTTPKPGKFKSQ